VQILNVPQRSYVKGLVPSLALLAGGGTFERWSLVEGLQVGGERGVLEGDFESLISAFFSLPLPGHEMNNFNLTCAPTVMCCHRPKSYGAKQSWSETY
jgi:hypothetical protein